MILGTNATNSRANSAARLMRVRIHHPLNLFYLANTKASDLVCTGSTNGSTGKPLECSIARYRLPGGPAGVTVICSMNEKEPQVYLQDYIYVICVLVYTLRGMTAIFVFEALLIYYKEELI